MEPTSLKNRSEVFLWSYIFAIGFIGLPLLGYFSSCKIPIALTDLPEILLCSALICAFWFLSLNVVISGFVTPIETTPWFLLTLFLIEGPTLVLVSYLIGTTIFSLLFPRAAIAKLATIVIGTIAYGLPLLLIWTYYPPNFQQPITVLVGASFALLTETLIYIGFGSVFHAIRDQITIKDSFLALTSGAFIDGILILVFPGLSYITVVFWKAHFYLEILLLFIPFILLRKAMQSVLKAVEEIANTIEAIVTVIEAKDPYTHYHCNRVALYATTIACFCGLNEGVVDRVARAARLHDIGKIMLKDRVLKKDSHLTDEEYEHIKLHADPNKILMNQIPDDIPLKVLIELGRHHHERFDGKGYPDGLAGENIPIEVRVISMADAWDAMTSDRVYRLGLPHDIAMSEIEKYKGKQWDPLIVEAFKEADGQGVIQQIIHQPELLKHPQPSWRITPKPLIFKAASNKIGFLERLNRFIKKQKIMVIPLSLFSLLFLLFALKASPLHENRLALFAGFAVLLELWEMKFLKYPRFSPVDAVYLALFFILPLQGILMLLTIATIIRIIYDRRIKQSVVRDFIHRIIYFEFSILFFKWIGFSLNQNLWIPRHYFKNPYSFLHLYFVLSLWGLGYAATKFLLTKLETMVRRKCWRISWHFLSLKRTVLFELGLVVPFALLFSTFSAVSLVNLPYLSFCFVLILTFSYPLLEYFRSVIEGNAKTLEALALAADSRFSFYEGHTKEVAKLCQEIGASMGLSEEELESLQLSARIFGLGNIGIPDEILSKPDKLTQEEQRIMHQHVEISGQIAAQYSFYRDEVPVIWSHHENWNGSGYPSRLKENQIPLGARILAVADSFCAMLSDRPYRKALLLDEAFREIKNKAGIQFDPKVVEAFRKVI